MTKERKEKRELFKNILNFTGNVSGYRCYKL